MKIQNIYERLYLRWKYFCLFSKRYATMLLLVPDGTVFEVPKIIIGR